jgi:hypothetical protein
VENCLMFNLRGHEESVSGSMYGVMILLLFGVSKYICPKKTAFSVIVVRFFSANH